MKIVLKDGAPKVTTLGDLKVGDLFTVDLGDGQVAIVVARHELKDGYHYLLFSEDNGVQKCWDMDDTEVTKLRADEVQLLD